MRLLAAITSLRRAPVRVGLRVGGMIVPIHGTLLVRVVVLASALLVVPDRLALPRRDGSHALHRDGGGEQ